MCYIFICLCTLYKQREAGDDSVGLQCARELRPTYTKPFGRLSTISASTPLQYLHACEQKINISATKYLSNFSKNQKTSNLQVLVHLRNVGFSELNPEF